MPNSPTLGIAIVTVSVALLANSAAAIDAGAIPSSIVSLLVSEN